MVFALGCGKTGPDPSADVTLEDGTIVPVGKGTNTSVANSSLLYNEYPFIHDQKLEDSSSSVGTMIFLVILSLGTRWFLKGVSFSWLFFFEIG